jgi:hypothetical protein
MRPNNNLLLFLTLFCIGNTLHAQVEVAHLFTKGESSTGYGIFIRPGFPIGKADEISFEAGVDFFTHQASHIADIPLLVGYRHTLNGSGAGFYLEPFAGYAFGGTDITKTDAEGNIVYNSAGNAEDENLSGPATGLGFGYIIPRASLPLNIGLRYEHIFVSGEPSQNILALRISWSLLTAKRLSSH